MRPLALLCAALALGGCAHTTAARAPLASAPSVDDAGAKAAEARATAALAAGRYDDALAELAPFAGDPDARWAHAIAYARATALLYKRDFAAAGRVFEALVEHARSRQQPAREVWPHNALTWVRWAEHDATRALAENEEVARAAARLPEADRRGPMLHYLWDRAYLLKEQPAQAAAAAEARRRYEALARMPDEHDGVAVLAAFFAVVDGDGAAALAAARTVDAARDDDVQDLYVLHLAHELGGDKEGAAAIRAQIGKANEYPMKPIILERLDYDRQTARR